jgi:hypothetical protein
VQEDAQNSGQRIATNVAVGRMRASSSVSFLGFPGNHSWQTDIQGDHAQERRNFSVALVAAPRASLVCGAQEFPQLSLLRASFAQSQCRGKFQKRSGEAGENSKSVSGITDNLQLCCTKDSHTKTNIWWVERAGVPCG